MEQRTVGEHDPCATEYGDGAARFVSHVESEEASIKPRAASGYIDCTAVLRHVFREGGVNGSRGARCDLQGTAEGGLARLEAAVDKAEGAPIDQQGRLEDQPAQLDDWGVTADLEEA